MTIITLCTLPFLDLSYANVIDFKNEDTRTKYINTRKLSSIETNIKYDGSRPYITINKRVEDLHQVDYLHFKDSSNKQYFYFITNKTMVNQSSTRLDLKLDIWQTYLFDYEFLHSFIDRSHLPRWQGGNPIAYVEDEALDIGEYIQVKKPEIICSMEDSIVITSSVPIGKVSLGGTGGGGITPPSNGNDGNGWQEGILSSQGFRFIKGWEGYAPKQYQDSAGYWTIGYGITKHGELDIYNEFVSLSNQGKLNEEICARKSYDLKNSRYGKKIVTQCKKIGITKQYQFDALVSFSFNLGNGIILDDNSPITKAIKNDITNKAKIKEAFNLYNKAGGKVEPGLVARRKAEGEMFFNESYEIRKITKIPYSLGYVTENKGNGWLPTTSTSQYRQINNEFGKWTCPTTGTVTALYPHYQSGGEHRGNDIANSSGTNIRAMRKGKVTKSGEYSGGGMETYGKVVFIDHENGLSTRYAHNSQLLVNVDDNVEEGQVIAKMGTTGNSNGNHCHFEVLKNNVPKNPSDLKIGEVII